MAYLEGRANGQARVLALRGRRRTRGAARGLARAHVWGLRPRGARYLLQVLSTMVFGLCWDPCPSPSLGVQLGAEMALPAISSSSLPERLDPSPQLRLHRDGSSADAGV